MYIYEDIRIIFYTAIDTLMIIATIYISCHNFILYEALIIYDSRHSFQSFYEWVFTQTSQFNDSLYSDYPSLSTFDKHNFIKNRES